MEGGGVQGGPLQSTLIHTDVGIPPAGSSGGDGFCTPLTTNPPSTQIYTHDGALPAGGGGDGCSTPMAALRAATCNLPVTSRRAASRTPSGLRARYLV